MNVAILGDLHIGVSSNSQILWEHQRDFFVNEFFPVLRERGIKLIIQTGDFFDNRTAVHHTAMYNAQWLCGEAGKDFEWIIIVGNHDIPFKNTIAFDSINPVLGHFDNVFLQDSINQITDFLFVPWVTPGKEEFVCEAFKNPKTKYCVGHFDVIGGRFNKHGQLSTHGLQASDFKKFDRVISGHYHTKSKIGNIDFVGTPYELDWNDWNDQKGFHIFDTQTNELEFIPRRNNLFFKIIHDETGSKTIPENHSGDFVGKFVKIESNSMDKEAIRGVIDQVGAAANVQTVLTKPTTEVIITDIASKSVTQAILDATDSCKHPAEVRAILARAIEKVKEL